MKVLIDLKIWKKAFYGLIKFYFKEFELKIDLNFVTIFSEFSRNFNLLLQNFNLGSFDVKLHLNYTNFFKRVL